MSYKMIVNCNKWTIRTNGCIHWSHWWHFIVLKVLLIIILYDTRVSSQSKQIRNLQIFEDNSEPVFRVIVNSDNNDIIVGARNVVYRLSSDDLQKIDEFKTGPVNDSIDCPPPVSHSECGANKKLVNNDNKILLLYKQRNQFTLLLACGDAYQGMCYALKAENLTWNKLYGQPDNPLNYLGSKSSSYAFFAPSPIENKDAVYVAQAYDGRPLEFFANSSVSSRVMKGYDG